MNFFELSKIEGDEKGIYSFKEILLLIQMILDLVILLKKQMGDLKFKVKIHPCRHCHKCDMD